MTTSRSKRSQYGKMNRKSQPELVFSVCVFRIFKVFFIVLLVIDFSHDLRRRRRYFIVLISTVNSRCIFGNGRRDNLEHHRWLGESVLMKESVWYIYINFPLNRSFVIFALYCDLLSNSLFQFHFNFVHTYFFIISILVSIIILKFYLTTLTFQGQIIC